MEGPARDAQPPLLDTSMERVETIEREKENLEERTKARSERVRAGEKERGRMRVPARDRDKTRAVYLSLSLPSLLEGGGNYAIDS